MTKRRIAAEPRRYWSAEEDAILRARFPHELTATIAAAIGRTLSATHGRAKAIGLVKSEAFRLSSLSGRLLKGEERGKATRFKPGQAPANKGVRGRKGWAPGRMKDNQFKAGQLPHNTYPTGGERVIDGYLWRKTSNTPNVPWTKNWRQVHLIVWEQANGPIPKGHSICFRNGDRSNCRLDNLECVSKADWMKRHTLHNYPAPIKQAYQLIGAVTKQIRKRERHAEEQDRRPA